jgi:hypothetical protein
LVTVSVSEDESRSKWSAAVQHYGMTWPQSLDEDGTVNGRYGEDRFPAYILVDPDGMVVYEGRDVKNLAQVVKKALDPAPNPLM